MTSRSRARAKQPPAEAIEIWEAARAKGWTCELDGWWKHPRFGSVYRAEDGTAQWVGFLPWENRRPAVGPVHTMLAAMDALEKAFLE